MRLLNSKVFVFLVAFLMALVIVKRDGELFAFFKKKIRKYAPLRHVFRLARNQRLCDGVTEWWQRGSG
jgi:hypothetical protein